MTAHILGMDMYAYVMATLLACVLSVPVGPVGFTAGERGALGQWRVFALIGLGCIVADVTLAVMTVAAMHFMPAFGVGDVLKYENIWLMMGLLLVAVGGVLMLMPPKGGKAEVKYPPFLFGFGLTFVWPTTGVGIFAAFWGANIAGWLPPDLGGRLLVALCLGMGTTLLWTGWALLCRWIGRRVGVDTIARWFHRAMSGSIVVGGFIVMTKPYFA